MRLYELALRRDPDNHFLLIDLAREYGLHNQLHNADQKLSRVIELYPHSAKVRSMVAASYAMIGLPQQAIEHYRLALELEPLHPESTAIRTELELLAAPERIQPN
jgi:tetratricopeptide (TPR) repeat protein